MRRSVVPTVSIFCTLLLSVAACDRTPAAPSDGGERADQTVQGATAGTLSLFVPIDSVVPAVGVPITVFASGTNDSPVVDGRTDDQGVFTAVLEAGRYDVVMTVPDGLYLAPHTSGRAHGVAVITNETVDVEGFALSSKRPLTRVWGEVGIEGLGPVADALLTIRKNGEQVQRLSDDDGRFDFGVVDPGKWQLLIAPPPGYILADGQISPVLLPELAGGDILPLRIDLATADGAGRIHVLALADSAVVAGVVLTVLDGAGTRVVETNTTDSGGIVIALPPGPYQVEAIAPTGYELIPGDEARRDVDVRTGRLSRLAFSFRRRN